MIMPANTVSKLVTCGCGCFTTLLKRVCDSLKTCKLSPAATSNETKTLEKVSKLPPAAASNETKTLEKVSKLPPAAPSNETKTLEKVSKLSPAAASNETKTLEKVSKLRHAAPSNENKTLEKVSKLSPNEKNTLKKASELSPNEKNVRKLKDSLKIRKLPPIAQDKKYTVFLDLDNTLIHCELRSSTDRPPRNYDFIVKYKYSDEIGYVTKRPFLYELLDDINKRNIEIVIFTAGTRTYASPLLDILDPEGLISHRLYRTSCTVFPGHPLVKDLSRLGRDLNNVVIIDDDPSFTRYQPSNAIRIEPFFGSRRDRELLYIRNRFFREYYQKLLPFYDMKYYPFYDMKYAVFMFKKFH